MSWENLESDGLLVIDDFADPTALAAECADLYARGLFKRAGVGKQKTTDKNIRSDETLWWENEALTIAQKALFQKLDELRESINREFFLSLHDWEGHYARYAPGAYYEKHLDRFRDDDRRTLSTVFYLNSNWKPSDGGALIAYPPDQPAQTILPEAGRLVVFLSDRIPHEVQTSHKERWSVAGWFRRR